MSFSSHHPLKVDVLSSVRDKKNDKSDHHPSGSYSSFLKLSLKGMRINNDKSNDPSDPRESRAYKSDHPWIYDVFISFRGEDTRGNFVSHLYAALSNAGIYTFLDDKKLKKGKKLGAQLKRAIEGSRICIIVLSGKYAGSSWCLDEL
ncbi:disease resistance protein (TIR-NBS-LRR class), partial [Trifolium pratense]